MAKTRMLIVEDESIVARDLANRLKCLKYAVSAVRRSERFRWDSPLARCTMSTRMARTFRLRYPVSLIRTR